MTKRRLWRPLVGLLVVAALGAFAWFAAQRALGPRVVVVRPSRREVVQTVVSSGRVLSPGEVTLGSLLAGVVSTVTAREGDRVAAHQVLVTLDDADLAAQVAQARAGVLVASARVGQLLGVGARVADESVRQAEANLRAVTATRDRQRALIRTGAVSAAEMDAAQRAYEVAASAARSARITAAGASAGGGDARVASAGRTQAEAALEVAEARLAQTRIVAPAAGVVLRRSVEPGDAVTPGRALMVLLRDGETELGVTPDERYLADLRVGQRGVASAEAFPDRPFPVEVSWLAPAVDALHGTIEVKLRVPTPPDYLRPAMTVSVEVEVARRAGALTLSPEAVHGAATAAPWVLVVGADRRAARRAVTIGLRGQRVVEITAGVSEADAVVPASAPVAVGQRVRPTAP
jgi:HlyD family secretion protein